MAPILKHFFQGIYIVLRFTLDENASGDIAGFKRTEFDVTPFYTYSGEERFDFIYRSFGDMIFKNGLKFLIREDGVIGNTFVLLKAPHKLYFNMVGECLLVRVGFMMFGKPFFYCNIREPGEDNEELMHYIGGILSTERMMVMND